MGRRKLASNPSKDTRRQVQLSLSLSLLTAKGNSDRRPGAVRLADPSRGPQELVTIVASVAGRRARDHCCRVERDAGVRRRPRVPASGRRRLLRALDARHVASGGSNRVASGQLYGCGTTNQFELLLELDAVDILLRLERVHRPCASRQQ